jgi:hypothetical protein
VVVIKYYIIPNVCISAEEYAVGIIIIQKFEIRKSEKESPKKHYS